jgi:DNA-binding FadR family transcriptional regulator
MLVVETIAKIRRGYFVQGKAIKAISRELKVSRKVVRKVIRSGETAFVYERRAQPQPKLGPWREDLERLLAANAARSNRERLTLVRLSRSCAVLANAAATMRCGATRPDGGVSRARRLRRLCR